MPEIDFFERDRNYESEYAQWIESLSPEELADIRRTSPELLVSDVATFETKKPEADFSGVGDECRAVSDSGSIQGVVLREIFDADSPKDCLQATLYHLGSPIAARAPSVDPSEVSLALETDEARLLIVSLLEACAAQDRQCAALAVLLKHFKDPELSGISDREMGIRLGESKGNLNQVRRRLEKQLGIEIYAGKSNVIKAKHSVQNRPKRKKL
ncbi:MAG: hypothetical protein AAF236_06640 [Verrucomicrobiota bacterium]